jgi:hypothetical protein
MLYIFIDESGDIGNPKKEGTSSDFSMCACVCKKELIDKIDNIVFLTLSNINKTEIKYSKLSKKYKKIIKSIFKKFDINIKTVYLVKRNNFHADNLLKNSFDLLISGLKIDKKEKVKIIIDGMENSHYRKIYSKILNKYFDKYVLYFRNSHKTPMLQVADFYAGLCRDKG